jgi:hypothetical protein
MKRGLVALGASMSGQGSNPVLLFPLHVRLAAVSGLHLGVAIGPRCANTDLCQRLA